MGVLANPAETLRQLNESRDMLRKVKEDIERANEAKKIPKKRTFAKLPGFHGRKVEQILLRRILSHEPKLTVIFGATSVGKTALLREVLATDDFYVVNFDLRISGFADLRTLYIALCEQFQRFFEEVSTWFLWLATINMSRCTMMRWTSRSSHSSIWYLGLWRRRKQRTAIKSRLLISLA